MIVQVARDGRYARSASATLTFAVIALATWCRYQSGDRCVATALVVSSTSWRYVAAPSTPTWRQDSPGEALAYMNKPPARAARYGADRPFRAGA